MTFRILTVVGARPQFVKAAALSRYIRENLADAVSEQIVHTGQHYDDNMSDVFFTQLDIPRPTFRFEVEGTTHGAMTGKMLADIEGVLLSERPDCLLVYGDTNSTLAGALAAAKIHVPVAHVEAGLRSFNKRMPEEINRIMSDHISTRLYCPTDRACQNLANEGITKGVRNVGDIMYDVALHYADLAVQISSIMRAIDLTPGGFVLATIHRAENTDSPERIEAICRGLGLLAEQMDVVFPLHPRTRKIIQENGLGGLLGKTKLVDPVPFLDMVVLQKNARAICTDSGGVQKEAFFYGVPCITLRDETEWVETVDAGWNKLVTPQAEDIRDAVLSARAPRGDKPNLYGTGNTAQTIVSDLLEHVAGSNGRH